MFQHVDLIGQHLEFQVLDQGVVLQVSQKHELHFDKFEVVVGKSRPKLDLLDGVELVAESV